MLQPAQPGVAAAAACAPPLRGTPARHLDMRGPAAHALLVPTSLPTRRGGGWGPLRRAPVQHLDMRGRPGLLRTTLEAQETRGLTRSDDLSRLLPSEASAGCCPQLASKGLRRCGVQPAAAGTGALGAHHEMPLLRALTWPPQALQAALLARGRTVRQAKLFFYAKMAEKGLATYERDGWGEFPTQVGLALLSSDVSKGGRDGLDSMLARRLGGRGELVGSSWLLLAAMCESNTLQLAHVRRWQVWVLASLGPRLSAAGCNGMHHLDSLAAFIPARRSTLTGGRSGPPPTAAPSCCVSTPRAPCAAPAR